MEIYDEVEEMMAKDYIFTENTTVGYGRILLIGQIKLHVRRGEIATLIGPNGARKSMILKSVTQQLGPLGGTVYLDGQSIEGMTEKRIVRRMSVLMTERVRPELMTCKDAMDTNRYPYTGRPGILTAAGHKKVRETTELVHAGELADRDFMEISDGQKQRVLLARVVCQEPEAIVLDESTSFLDIRHKLELLTILKDLVHEKRVAVLMSLRELNLAQKLSNFVVYIKGDAIERCSTPEKTSVSSCIKEFYSITEGSYYAETSCLEMGPVKGEPKVFVIGGNGSGISVYRRLQRQGIPFAAGILHEDDMDYPVARVLASEVISKIPFEPIRDTACEQAVSVLRSCEQVICCLSEFGTLNEKNKELAEVKTCLRDLRRI